jgi:hypothetical protein
MANILEQIGNTLGKADWGRILPAAGLAYAGAVSPGVAQGYMDVAAKEKETRQKENMLNALKSATAPLMSSATTTPEQKAFINAAISDPEIAKMIFPEAARSLWPAAPSTQINLGGGFGGSLPSFLGSGTGSVKIPVTNPKVLADLNSDPTKLIEGMPATSSVDNQKYRYNGGQWYKE